MAMMVARAVYSSFTGTQPNTHTANPGMNGTDAHTYMLATHSQPRHDGIGSYQSFTVS